MNVYSLITLATVTVATLAPPTYGQTAAAPTGVVVSGASATAKPVVTPVVEGAAALRTTLQESRQLVAKPIGEIDPFTGQATGFQNLAHQLKLEKQKTAILNERLLQVRALEDMEKTGFRAAPERGAVPGIPPGTPVIDRPRNDRSAPAMQEQQQSRARIVRTVARAAKPPATVAPREPVVAAAPVPVEPKLVGVTTVAGRSYALFQLGDKSLLIPENGSLGATRVGDIHGNQVMVNGASRQVNVGGQEVVVLPTTKQEAATLAAAAPTATIAIPVVPTNPNADIRAMTLPSAPTRAALRGPQPLQSNIPAYLPPSPQ